MNAIPQETKGTQPPDDQWEAVEGLDRKTVELKRAYEAQVEKKVADDATAIIWAYGIMWSLFAIYGMMLWRRATRLDDDLKALDREFQKLR